MGYFIITILDFSADAADYIFSRFTLLDEERLHYAIFELSDYDQMFSSCFVFDKLKSLKVDFTIKFI